MISRGNSQRLPSFGAFAGLVAILASCILLTGCGPSDSYKYKLTLSVDTPDGVKSGFSVVEVHVTQAPAFWGGGVGSTARGEAVYVDLGPGRRPLIAVMTLYRAKTKGMIWAEGKPDARYLLSRYGQPQPDDNFVSRVSRLKRHRGPLALTSADLPDLVTFADINDPRSVLAVDANNLSRRPMILLHRRARGCSRPRSSRSSGSILRRWTSVRSTYCSSGRRRVMPTPSLPFDC